MISRYKQARNDSGVQRNQHRVIVERVLGHALPDGAAIHHIDHDGRNNKNSNLVVCQSHAYHSLLHSRERAFDACGNANWLKCALCKNWDDPINLMICYPKGRNAPRSVHSECNKAAMKISNKKRKDKK